MLELNEKHMLRCFDLASKGLGKVAPNPLVGAVIVYDSRIIGEGYHQQYGKAHAEVNAIKSVTNHELLKKSTLYINLEPCSHFGKTPPCSDLIIQKQIPRVVISNTDPNPLVSGNGIKKLQEHGIEVISDFLSQYGYDLNKRFFNFHTKKRPYIFLKWAQTLDGFMDIQRQNPANKEKYWITNSELKLLVHKWRSEEQAIMIGSNTAINDNPKLNVREWVGENPTRIILAKNEILPDHLHIFDNNQKTIIFTSLTNISSSSNASIINIPENEIFLDSILNHLYNLQIQSVIIEGGYELLNSLINSELWNEAFVLIGNKNFGTGLKAPILSQQPLTKMTIENDTILYYNNH